MNMILIPRLGAKGDAIGTVCAEFSVTAIQIVLAREYFDFKKMLVHFFKVLVSLFVMSICVSCVCRYFNAYSIELVLGILLGALSYLLCMLILRDSLFVEIIDQILGRFYKNKTDKKEAR